MRDDIWIRRAELLEPFDGKGFTLAYIARRTGLTAPTLRSYEARFGFDFSRPNRGHEGSNRGFQDRLASIRDLAEQGKTRKEAAEQLGISYHTVVSYGIDHEIEFRHASEGVGVDHSRAEAMACMFRSGKTLNAIGEVYGVSRERVRQIIKRYHGLVGADGGQRASADVAKQTRHTKRDAASIEKNGCLYEQYRGLVRIGKEMRANGIGFSRTPTGAYHSQRANALCRGIDWDLKIWEWWQVWMRSGKWEARGRTKGSYVMCRFEDKGAYEVGNVYIATSSHNTSHQPNNPYRSAHPDFENTMARLRQRRASTPSIHGELQ